MAVFPWLTKFFYGDQQQKSVANVAMELLGRRVTNQPRRTAYGVLKAFSESPTLLGVAARISDDVASNEFYLTKTIGKTEQDIEEHDLINVLKRPVAGLPAYSQIYLVNLYLDLVGEAGLIKKRDEQGKVISLWPLPPTWIYFRPTDGVSPYLVDPVYGCQYEIPNADVIWFMKPDAADPYGRGVGTGQALSDEVEISELSSKTIKQWFLNGGKPDVLIVGESMDKSQTDVLEQKWDERHGGFWKKYRPAFMGGTNVSVHNLTSTFQEMELTELRLAERRVIQQTYGVPPEILGDVQNSNRATITASEYIYSKRVLTPRLKLIYGVLNYDLVKEFEPGLILHYINPVEADREFQKSVFALAPWAFSGDEYRDLAGMSPLPDGKGKVYMMSPMLMPVSSPSFELDYIEPEPEPEDTSKAMISAPDISARIKGIAAGIDFTKVEAALKKYSLEPAILPLVKEIVKAYGESTYDEFAPKEKAPKTFEFVNPRIAKFMRDEAGKRIKDIEDTTLDKVKAVLVKGELEALTIDQVARAVEDAMDAGDVSRSWTIARTETVRAANFGNIEAAKQLDIGHKEWLATKDGRTRGEDPKDEYNHVYLETYSSKNPVPLNEPFVGENGEEGMYPGDFSEAGMSINCRCTVLPVVNEKSYYDTVEKREARYKLHDRQRARYQIAMRREIRRVFAKQKAAVLAAIKE